MECSVPRSTHEVVVCIATQSRPKYLANCLAALTVNNAGSSYAVIVCDNDVSNPIGPGCLKVLPIAHQEFATYYIEPTPGIPAVRNSMLSLALSKYPDAKWVAMLDDDEISRANWLSSLLNAADLYDAAIVCGPQQYVCAKGGPKWLSVASGFLDHLNKSSGVIAAGLSTGNVLISTSLLRRIARPWFDPKFTASGGSDVDFFRRAARLGTISAFAEAAVVYEMCDGARLSESWWLKRMVRNGSIEARVGGANISNYKRFQGALFHIGRSLVGASLQYFILHNDHRHFRAMMRLSWMIGFIRGTFGFSEKWYQ